MRRSPSRRDGHGRVPRAGADRTDERRYTESPMQALDADFIEAVRRRDPSRVRTPYADAARTLAITLAGEESARTGRVIEVARI